MRYRWARRVVAFAGTALVSLQAHSPAVTSLPRALPAGYSAHVHVHRGLASKTKPKKVKKAKKPKHVPHGAPLGTTPAEEVFDLSGLRGRAIAWAQEVLNGSCDFDWSSVTPGLGGQKVRVALDDPPARGMYYPAEKRLVVHKHFYARERAVASRVLAWEAAHVVDLYSLGESQRAAISDLYHAHDDDHGWLSGRYDDQVGEAFMEGFVAAFCPSLSADATFSHRTTPEVADGIRDLLS